ncbi:MAG: SPFH domain-containing protein [Bacteroidales bacterium]|nr:SPFH domain-containing protein [Bacteroidales bacterium]
MGLWDKIKNELIDIIEWLDSSNDTMVYRYERYDNEIKNGAKLIVRESQIAIFINEGQIADVFGPGTYDLKTQNLPVLSKLKGWKHGFESPFKAEIYFSTTKRFTNRKWGTPNVIPVRDADFGRVSIRAFGTYSMKIQDPVKFLTEIVGTDDKFTLDEIEGELRSNLVSTFTTSIGQSGLSLLDYASNYRKLSDYAQEILAQEFPAYGLEISKFTITSISLPEKLQEKLDQGTGMNMLGDMDNYTKMKTADALGDAAKSGSGTGGGIENMMGMAMMQQMMNQQTMTSQTKTVQNQQMAPPPPPMMQFYASINGQQAGPYDMNTFMQMIQQQQIKRQTNVWKQGMPAWLPAGQVAELTQYFGAIPPPPPPM